MSPLTQRIYSEPSSLGRLFDCLSEYAEEWELSVNISKTNIMVYNSSSRILKCAQGIGFTLGSLDIKPARNYYLGIQFSLNGSFKQAAEELKKEGITILLFNQMHGRHQSAHYHYQHTTETDCPVWLPSTSLIKTLMAQDSLKTLPKAAAKDQLETTHLEMLKWILGVHRKANNFATVTQGACP